MAEVHFDKNIEISIPDAAFFWAESHCVECEELLEMKGMLYCGNCMKKRRNKK